ncbi:uncharacterized protein CTHT_0016760 [Thermochaetoides thermophila DSM 1495]|uniref:C6 transcription factor n=1 Tax=Chaetomium thermophilum (strain DSM 1495 / CBS 144.50 / IMI 039719) TaxID=759272 RepID=G0S2C6_CHATD|nr:hypothetical protein CTHT_0016760 [Thermochaetoides thermophila DSM 1495]EGS22159.1 hypothetical protein CTHT_0016760 [Thermochaetoides thermophila DSM 1495]
MQPLFPGLETVEDMIFWRHYNEHLSTVLTVEGEHRNAFKDIMVPIAVRHQGLMHSILSLASKHLDFDTPYGINLLKNNPTTSREALRERSIYHHEQARQKFYEDIESTNGKPSIDDKTLISARYGQMLCFLLEALAEGSPRGEHRLHLNAYRSLISTSPPEDPAFLSFISEFFQYHIYADELIHTALAGDNNWPPKRPPPVLDIHPPRLLGVADGMLECLSEITAIRNSIRANMLAEEDPVVDYEKLYRATQIDAKIREWVSDWPSGDNRNRVTAIYQQMLWIYLVRTVYPPSSSPPPSLPSSTTSSAMRYGSPSHSRPTSSVVNTPPQSASTSCASSPRLAASNPMHDDKEPTPARTYSQHPGGRTADSPPPTRHPVHHDPRITQAVDEALSLLEEFKPSDPCQTLLLLPCFLIGTAAFSTTQQRRIRGVIRNVRGYTGLRNADRVMEVLEEIWRLMEMGQWAAVWDWPGVARRLGLDFIPA